MKKFSLLFAVFIDRLSLAIALVIFPSMFLNESYAGLLVGAPTNIKPILLGITLSVYFIGQFFSNGIFGKLSDAYGRKNIFTITFTGTFFGFALTALAIDLQTLWLLLIGRLVTGIFAANQAIAFSSMNDISTKETKVHNFSLLEMAQATGFVSSGLLGIVLSNKIISASFSSSLLFWFVAAIVLLNLIILTGWFEETLKTFNPLHKISFLDGVTALHRAFSTVHLSGFFVIWLLFGFGWQLCLQFVTSFLMKEYQFLPQNLGVLFTVAGLIYVGTQHFIVKKIGKLFEPLVLLRWVVLLVALFWGLVAAMPSWQLAVAMFLGCSIFIGISVPNMFAQLSNLAHGNNQGEAMGFMVVIMACSVIIATLVGGFLMALNSAAPFILGSFSIASSWILLLFFKGDEQ